MLETMSALQESSHKMRKVLPWIVTVSVAVVALIVSVIVVRAVRGENEVQNAVAASETHEDVNTANSLPQTNPVPGANARKVPQSDDRVPTVEVGNTFELNIGQWNTKVQISQKMSRIHYELRDNANIAYIESALTQKLPRECAEMRTQFGFARAQNGTLTVVRPTEKCAAAPDMYNEIWGLLDAAAKTARVSAGDR